MTVVLAIGSGLVFAAATTLAHADDCNSNGIPDECDIDCGEPGDYCYDTFPPPQCGQSQDCNTNGVPDECDLGEYHLVHAWGTFGTEPGQFHDPAGVGVDSAGFVYVVDRGNFRVQKFTSNGEYVCEWPTTNGTPKQIAVDESDGCYVHVGYFYDDEPPGPGYLIEKFPCDCTTSVGTCGEPGAGPGQFRGLGGVAVDSAGNLYAVDWENDRFQKLASNCDYQCQGGTHGSGPGQFNDPSGVAVACGHVHVGDSWNERVQVWTLDCSYVDEWDTFGRPWGLAADSEGNVFVTVHTNNTVLKYSCEGTLLTQWGTEGVPIGVAVDSAGSVYVADGSYHRILKYRPCSDCNENGVLDECDLADCDGSPWCSDCNTNGVPDECDIASGTSEDNNSDGISDECVAPVYLDIKPGSCPNPLNRSSHGVLPVAVPSTESFDVTEIDVPSVRLRRADGVGNEVAPNEGPPGPHSVLEDVATPFEGEACDCHDLSGDGLDDLSMKFRTDHVVEGLELYELNNGDVVELVITGSLVDGTEFTSAGDCVLIVPQGNTSIHVRSSAPDAFIEVAPPDLKADASGFADFRRTYSPGITITLTAPETFDSADFAGWEIDGIPVPGGAPTLTTTLIHSNTTIRALY